MGIYLLIGIAFSLLGSLPLLFLSGFSKSFGNIWPMFPTLMLYTAFILLIIFLLIKKADFWAGKIVGIEEEKPELPKDFWMPVAFRLAAVFAGMFFMNHLLTDIITKIYYYIYSRSVYSPASDVFDVQQLLTWAVQLTLVIYFLCGAPHFVRWHIKKILEQSENNKKQPDTLSLDKQA
jgi:hypothetical protein